MPATRFEPTTTVTWHPVVPAAPAEKNPYGTGRKARRAWAAEKRRKAKKKG